MSPQCNHNLEWNPAPGARLPLDGDGVTIASTASFGTGTKDDPRVSLVGRRLRIWCSVQFKGAELNEFNEFVRQICKDLGFTHIWIRAFAHDWKTRRDTITAYKTGGIQKGEDFHITVYLGDRPDWINAHGDIYVDTRKIGNGKKMMPIGLMRTEKMKLQDDKAPRNPRLYVWTEKDTGRTTEKHDVAMASSNWRSNIAVKR
ncbi:hypothetical protein GGR55DRAFT_693268 [Xylaria sp. FL0064]|nr:hypothetical protein GGR55DRAFT_693268 [Xylaria sp. FL0064]